MRSRPHALGGIHQESQSIVGLRLIGNGTTKRVEITQETPSFKASRGFGAAVFADPASLTSVTAAWLKQPK